MVGPWLALINDLGRAAAAALLAVRAALLSYIPTSGLVPSHYRSSNRQPLGGTFTFDSPHHAKNMAVVTNDLWMKGRTMEVIGTYEVLG